jgi:hypothetical protein
VDLATGLARGLFINLVFFRGLLCKLSGTLSSWSLCNCIHTRLYTFSLSRNTYTYYYKKILLVGRYGHVVLNSNEDWTIAGMRCANGYRSVASLFVLVSH